MTDRLPATLYAALIGAGRTDDRRAYELLLDCAEGPRLRPETVSLRLSLHDAHALLRLLQEQLSGKSEG